MQCSIKQMVLTQTEDRHTQHSTATIISHHLPPLSHTVAIGWWCSYLMTRWEVYHFLLSVFRFLWLSEWMGEWHLLLLHPRSLINNSLLKLVWRTEGIIIIIIKCPFSIYIISQFLPHLLWWIISTFCNVS